MGALADWKRRRFPKGIRRWLEGRRNRLFHRTGRRALARAVERLGLDQGAVIGIHARLSAFGYLPDGPESVIHAVRDAVPGATVVMPTFPIGRTMVEYVEADPVFDPARTPSASGLLSEAFRRIPETLRSGHPTHPCAALGPCAGDLLAGTEEAATPFGDESGYGRYCRRDDAWQLLFHTNSTSIVHRVQEEAGMPNLFLPGTARVRGLDARGEVRSREVAVHTPRLPLYVAVPDGGSGTFQYVWMPDYCMLFPSGHRTGVLQGLRSPTVARDLAARDDAFRDQDIFRTATVHGAEILAFRVRPWLDAMVAELRDNLAEHDDAYDPGTLRRALGR